MSFNSLFASPPGATGHRGWRRLGGLAARFAVGAMLVATAACGGTSANPTSGSLSGTDCSQAVPAYSALTIWPLCTGCHSSTLSASARQGAPSNVNFDSYAPAVRAASEAAMQVSGGEMPPAGHTQPSSDEKTALYQWALCGTPE